MASDAELRSLLMRARGSAALALSIIDNAGSTPAEPLIAQVRASLITSFAGDLPLQVQVCENGQHTDWLAEAAADTPPLPCPWCRILTLEAELEVAGERPVWDLSGAPNLAPPAAASEAS
ncbi:hypothetical protein ACGFNU_21625 [Spirillospora sp. NPDC048911]|uniref:hypothetical protein n=1 Tax=Spirillospora sp. NPDC048911 TaxID=3364527 RepID=UPI00371AF3D7